MKTAALFLTLLAATSAKKCIVKAPEAAAADDVANLSDVESGEVAPSAGADEPQLSEAEDVAPVTTDDAELSAGDDDVLPPLDNPEDSAEGSDDEKPKNGKLPADFKWGAASAAYQVEGGWDADGRGESVWDKFTHLYPRNVETGRPEDPNSTNGNVASNSYDHELFKQDVKMLQIMKAKYYRFSISWSRIFPDGQAKKVKGKWNANEKGAQYYDFVIDTLLDNDIIPFVTLYHWDLPYALHEKYGGWLDYHSQYDFAAYAEYCFERYGDRVKNWITINEPWVNCVSGYKNGPGKAPYRCYGEAPRKLNPNNTLDIEGGCSYEIGPSQYAPESEVLPANRVPSVELLEDVWCSHNILLAHGQAVKIYREKYQKKQNGLIGITIDGEAQIPWKDATTTEEQLKENEKYANLAAEFRIGWYSDPPITGDYPKSIKERMGKDLPKFTKAQKKLLKGSSDFLGWNTYTSHWAEQAKDEEGKLIQPPTAEEANYANSRRDIWEDNCRGRKPGWVCVPPTLGSQAGSSWNTKYGPTIRVGLNWFSNRYSGMIKNGIVITENGCAQPNYKVSRPNDKDTLELWKSIGQEEIADTYDESMIEHEDDLESLIDDKYRIDWYAKYLENLRLAYVEDGVDIRGYMAWSIIDNFEWENGYETRFGMTYIDFYNDPTLQRKPKKSLDFLAKWYTENVEQK